MMTRRTLLGALAAGGLATFAGRLVATADAGTAGRAFPVTLPDTEWRARLTDAQYAVLRGHGTERAGSSPLNAEKRPGVYACAGCSHPLFDAATKFESGTGWPSFFEPMRGAVGTAPDRSFFTTRTEVHCANCGGHLGHVFEDGPPPTGLRYCMNGVALAFQPAAA